LLDRRSASSIEALWDLAAVVGQFLHDGLVQGDVLLGAAMFAGMHAQLIGQALSSFQTGVQFQKLEKVDDRGAPIAAAAFDLRTASTSTGAGAEAGVETVGALA
jgi:hypothetical protein